MLQQQSVADSHSTILTHNGPHGCFTFERKKIPAEAGKIKQVALVVLRSLPCDQPGKTLANI